MDQKLFTIYTSSKYVTYLSGTTEMNSKSAGLDKYRYSA